MFEQPHLLEYISRCYFSLHHCFLLLCVCYFILSLLRRLSLFVACFWLPFHFTVVFFHLLLVISSHCFFITLPLFIACFWSLLFFTTDFPFTLCVSFHFFVARRCLLLALSAFFISPLFSLTLYLLFHLIASLSFHRCFLSLCICYFISLLLLSFHRCLLHV